MIETKSIFTVLLGPSGVGKSTIMSELTQRDERFRKVATIMDRPLREGETEKISISKEALTELEAQGLFLIVNHAYGFRYATPKKAIDEMLSDGALPMLDFPLTKVGVFDHYEERLCRVYLAPPSLKELYRRINLDDRDPHGHRYRLATDELSGLGQQRFKHPQIDQVIVNHDTHTTTDLIQKLVYERLK